MDVIRRCVAMAMRFFGSATTGRRRARRRHLTTEHLEVRCLLSAGIPRASAVDVVPDAPQIILNAEKHRLWEWGGAKPLEVSLNRQPETEVTVSLTTAADAADDLLLSAEQLVFTSTNWAVPQQVLVGAVRDTIADGLRESDVIVSVVDEVSSSEFLNTPSETIQFTTHDVDRIVIPKPWWNPRSLSWQPHLLAESYDVVFEEVGNPDSLVRYSHHAETRIDIDPPGIGRYRLWVAAHLPDGSRTGWNAMTFDVLLPIYLHHPVENEAEELIVSWSPVDNAAGYELFLGNRQSGQWDFVGGIVTETTANLGEVPFGINWIWVRAVNATGFRANWSHNVSHINIDPVEPIERRKREAPDNVRFEWHPYPGAESYSLNFTDGVNRWQFTGLQDLWFVPEVAFESVLVEWQVRAILKSGLSTPWEWNGKVLFVEEVRVTDVSFTEKPGLVTLHWNAPVDAVDYDVWLGGARLCPIPTDTNHLSFPLGRGSYTIWIKTRYESKNPDHRFNATDELWSEPFTFEVIGTDDTVSGLEGTQVSVDNFELTWQPTPEAISYDLLLQPTRACKGSPRIQTYTDLEGNSYTLHNKLSTGRWDWAIRPVMAGGVPGRWMFGEVLRQGIYIIASVVHDQVQLSWNAVSEARGYELWIRDSFWRIRRDTVDTNTFTFSPSRGVSVYRVWVRALGEDTANFDWSGHLDVSIPST